MKQKHQLLVVCLAFFFLGFGLVALRPLGFTLARLPGDMGDPRLVNYLLEHVYRWATGKDASFWNVSFYYPFPMVTAFSDHMLGSAPFYFLFRGPLRLSRETSYQCWHLLSFPLSFASAAFVLARMKFHPLAVALGAYYFAFGIPLLYQQGHGQLIYRFGIPLACYMLWQLFERPQLRSIAALAGWLTWTYVINIYLGVFLFLLLLILFLMLLPMRGVTERLKGLRDAWAATGLAERIGVALVLCVCGIVAVSVTVPYLTVLDTYGFTRSRGEIYYGLPRLQSYLRADDSLFWRGNARLFSYLLTGEHQLFPGVILFLGIAGIVARVRTAQRPFAFCHLYAAAALVLLTLSVGGKSVWGGFLADLPGFNSIRAVTRVELVLMWPLAVFGAFAADGLLRSDSRLRKSAAYLFAMVLVAESVFFFQPTVSKQEALARLDRVRFLVPQPLPADPVVFLSWDQRGKSLETSLDAMLFAQDQGWATVNGYSGNAPLADQYLTTCDGIRSYLSYYQQFSEVREDQVDPAGVARRVVPLGFSDCPK